MPVKRLTMRTPGAPFPMETTYTWEDENPQGENKQSDEPREDYVRFTELHTRHHEKQMAAR